MKKIAANDYIKIVEWSAKDRCFVGSAPPLIGHCCHGKDEADVYRQLGVIVAEWVALYNKEKKALPEPSAGKDYSGKFVLRVDPALHQLLATRALQQGDSLNSYAAKLLKKAAA
jgi:predicted HicB family RNase H-like nuclease